MDQSDSKTALSDGWTEWPVGASSFSNLPIGDLTLLLEHPYFELTAVNGFADRTSAKFLPESIQLQNTQIDVKLARICNTAASHISIPKPLTGLRWAVLSDCDSKLKVLASKKKMSYLSADWYAESFREHYVDKQLLREPSIERHASLSARRTDKKSVTVQECMELYSKEERMDLKESNLWCCSKCKKHVKPITKLSLWDLPPILILHMKRFQYSRWWRDKLDIFVDFPLTGLDVANFQKNPKAHTEPYDLIAVSNHYGGLGIIRTLVNLYQLA